MGGPIPHPREPAEADPIRVPVLTDCDWCGMPAEVVPWPEQSSLRFGRGPQRLRCLLGHWSLRDPSARRADASTDSR